jgi:hypothetical protein
LRSERKRKKKKEKEKRKKRKKEKRKERKKKKKKKSDPAAFASRDRITSNFRFLYFFPTCLHIRLLSTNLIFSRLVTYLESDIRSKLQTEVVIQILRSRAREPESPSCEMEVQTFEPMHRLGRRPSASATRKCRESD